MSAASRIRRPATRAAVLDSPSSASLTNEDDAEQESNSQVHAEMPPERTLPDELWSMVWSQLHLTDRIAVTEVSRHWRKTAIASPAVWRRLDYWNRPQKGVRCDGSCGYAALRRLHQWDAHFPSETLDGLDNVSGSNINLIRAILPRTGKTALFLSLRVLVDDSDAHNINQLAQLLQPYATRIRGIDIVAWSEEVPGLLLNHFDRLPGLRTLNVPPVRRNMSKDNRALTYHAQAFPALEELFLGPPEVVLPLAAGFVAPNLHTLTFHVTEADEILHALRSCPQLHTLTIHLKLAGELSDAEGAPDALTLEKISALGKRLRHVWLKDVVEGDEEWIREAFDHDALASLELVYFRSKLVTERPSPTAWKIFDRVSSGATLEMTHRDDELVIWGTDGRGFERVIAFATPEGGDEAIHDIFLDLLAREVDQEPEPFRDVKRLVLDISDCLGFLEAFPRDNRVEEIELLAVEESHPAMFIEEDSLDPETCFFPVIKTLRLVCVEAWLPPFPQHSLRFCEEFLSLDAAYDGLKFGDEQPLVLDIAVCARTD
ncbi:hypothetical protein AURDEDRAFT_124886 [Auricularia subglabra TFB-10046 SS5]|nr:hypothetical protein AURDEDRAFT_124886 [Auricularia subglabra TFB-10046 SS5]